MYIVSTMRYYISPEWHFSCWAVEVACCKRCAKDGAYLIFPGEEVMPSAFLTALVMIIGVVQEEGAVCIMKDGHHMCYCERIGCEA